MARRSVETRTVRARDGTELHVYDTGGSGLPLLIANGLGGPFAAWAHQVDYFADRYRVLSWDYRGLYRSKRPPGHPPRLDLVAQAEDVISVLDEAEVESAAVMGWSMGVQVVLQTCTSYPGRLSHLVLINGTCGRPLQGTAVPLAQRVAPIIVRQGRRFGGMGSALLRRATGWPETVLWLKRLGVVAESTDDDLFQELAVEFGAVDVGLYLDTLRQIEKHDVSRCLDRVAAPTLVLVGERDLFTSLPVAERMARRIAGSEILVIRGGTHYLVIEQPELVNLRVEKFFREHGYGAAY